MVKCKKCGHRTVLATGYANSFNPDEEPYENGMIEDPEQEEICTEVIVGIHYCEKCDEVSDAWIESPHQDGNKTAKFE
ncbi:hypothetical protein LCGC14_1720010 [marine sediment metagenome]|uniref:Uncharacterized protein n=1 Tax=marine sediment metagenome TaxID=412755 RepID=A0A0F9JT62_9ZZZZ